MPILAKQNEYVIPLTFKCNWNCSYCAIRNSYDYRDIISKDEIQSKIRIVPNMSRVTLTGGEPGLISRKDIEEYISLLVDKKCEIYIETNGLFIEKYPDLCTYFYEVLYHCTIDMEIDNNIILNNMQNLRYIIIVNDNNFKNLNLFLKKYNNIKFDIIEATYPYKDEITGPTLSYKNKYHIMTKYNSHMTKDSLLRMIKEKQFDKITWLFDKI